MVAGFQTGQPQCEHPCAEESRQDRCDRVDGTPNSNDTTMSGLISASTPTSRTLKKRC